MSRRSRRYVEKKPWSTNAIAATIAGTISLLMHVVVIMIAVSISGPTARVVGGIAVIGLLVALIALIRGAKKCHEENYSKIGNMIAVVVPLVATACWAILYIIGIFIG